MILVVDDEEPIRAFLTLVLEDAGYTVRTAIHGAQALELIAEGAPQLVISDVMMPVLDGIELCRRLKAANGIPVILMSAAGMDVLDGAPADALLPKPFDIVEMESLIASLIAPAH